nr:MAG TPA: toxin [Caudoviricetes sp.]DAY22042.1 MAG TPA: toxin [Caudoviricetes sp.]
MGDIYSIIYGAVGGGVTGVIAAILGGIAIAYFKRIMAERDKLAEARMASAEAEIANLKKDSQRHGEMLAAVNSLAKSVETLGRDIKQVLSTDAAQSQAITNLTNYIGNLREDLGELRKELQSHILLSMNTRSK